MDQVDTTTPDGALEALARTCEMVPCDGPTRDTLRAAVGTIHRALHPELAEAAASNGSGG